MDLFTLKYAGKKYRMSLVSLHPAHQGDKRDPKTYLVSCGAYKREAVSGRMVFKGLSLQGNVPVVELVRWARRKGFLKWTRRGGAKHERNAQRRTAAPIPATAGSGSERKVAG
ncbi:MAG: hypothetical protein L6R28_03875 [Planctomycetes bacterium]|nr:hypothetical protein [Planctomycetota bacterium]